MLPADPPTVLFTTPVAAGPVSVAVLPDGSRAYAVSSTKTPPCTSDPLDTQLCISSVVTVINASDGSVGKRSSGAHGQHHGGHAKRLQHELHLHLRCRGPALRPGMEMVVSGMADAGNNGTFTLAAVNCRNTSP